MTKILVIEDEAEVRDNIQEILELEDFETIVAPNGRIGVTLAKAQVPDLIICDVMMPELDGYGVLKELRQDAITATIPLIFLTAKAENSDLRQGMTLGADDYLTKPFTLAELRRAIATRLEKKAAVVLHYTNQIKNLGAKLEHLTYYDSLTNLPNQRLLRERFNQVKTQADSQKQQVAVLLISLDQFISLTSSLGHTDTEVLLKAVSQRLVNQIKPVEDDIDTVARLDMAQFAILLKPISCKQDAANVAQTILDVLSQPLLLSDREVFITSSIGIAFSLAAFSNLDNLISQAEVAMRHTKQGEGNGYEFYTTEMTADFDNRFTLAADLYHALEREEFLLFYQPQVDLKTGQIFSTEALVRWQHPERGLISPAEFIPLAEETGLIIPLGEWVLQTACAQAKAWQAAHSVPLQVAVNLSARQFSQPDLTKKIVRVLIETGLEPSLLNLELTESILIADVEAANKTLNELNAVGIQIAIDDFGIGYSSLSYLQKFSFHTLKIDQSFVRNITNNPGNIAITTAIIEMAHRLNLKVLAEGVETESELEFLYQHQCDAIQGYLFSPPKPAAELTRLLKAGQQLQQRK
ncbi:MAG: EAL domain-containing protein [Kastovskya adunca ATA6-11-RM4]|jgi:diguanylate cyclase (GGDEF)-like protein|nr:EAL domain-containing protein [Kastovskya adunca ATA6-11-RM4]